MAKLAFKPDGSFFDKIVRGAIGTRAVRDHLHRYGHKLAELERGSLDTKLWKDLKRKRVRMPDLVCVRCGRRVESRAKAKAELTMSHSTSDAERVWDFGMINEDWVAFPVCEATEKLFWSAGKLQGASSYWHERNWTRWKLVGRINLFSVADFRAVPFTAGRTKGVTEGSESVIHWPATFSTRTGIVEAATAGRIPIRRTSDNHLYTWKFAEPQTASVDTGDRVEENQVIASAVAPVSDPDLTCPGQLPVGHIQSLLESRERTLRFTGVKLARLLRDRSALQMVSALLADPVEDGYTRLEAASYLASVGNEPVNAVFAPFLTSTDEQTQLEAVIALGETDSEEVVDALGAILDETGRPYFLRSAAAWCLGQVGGERAVRKLVQLFGDVDSKIREEALDRIVAIGRDSSPVLYEQLLASDLATAAGCAEGLRQIRPPAADVYASVGDAIKDTTAPPVWPVWLLGNLPREEIAPVAASLQDDAPRVHYAISVLWSFAESWVAQRWERTAEPTAESTGDTDVV